MTTPTTAQLRYLRAAFERDRALFARAFPKLAGARLAVVERACSLPGMCAFRDLAYAESDRRGAGTVTVLARLATFPATNIAGLLRHELGHLADTAPYVPGTGREQAADDIAEYATGTRIYYDRRSVQTIDRGEYPRPPHLHQ